MPWGKCYLKHGKRRSPLSKSKGPWTLHLPDPGGEALVLASAENKYLDTVLMDTPLLFDYMEYSFLFNKYLRSGFLVLVHAANTALPYA